MRSDLRRVLLGAALSSTLAALLLGWVAPPEAVAKGKIKVSTVDELPRQTFEISGTVSELLASAEDFRKLKDQVKQHWEGILEDYEIQDASTLQQIYGTLQSVALLDGDYDAVLAYVEKNRKLEKKEAAKHTIGLVTEAYIAARRETEQGPSSAAFQTRFRERLTSRLEAMPWALVQDELEQTKGQMEIIGENLILGIVQSQLDPAVQKAGYLSGDQASQVVGLKSTLEIIIPVKQLVAEVLGQAIATRRVEKKNIWPVRDVELAEGLGHARVVLAVWDSGVDIDLFEGQRFTNPNEASDGRDTDGNGYVDDLHGIAYDLHFDRTTGLLHPLEEAEGRRTELEDMVKGFFDLTAAIDSPEATEIKKKMAGMAPEEVKPFIEDLSLYALHSHGTHVAGIAVAGNPYADVLASRLTFDHRMIPEPPTVEWARKFAKAAQDNVDYFKANGVRAVNMSWGVSLKELESGLEANGLGASAEERGKMAREILEILRQGLYEAFRSAPEILFVAAAGNSDNDVEFDEFIPSSLELPNLLTAGAVDQAGEATGFTSFGKTVRVYSNGFEVESYVPGGRKLPFSGTSMAAPNVLNLVGKLLVVDPSLGPRELIKLIRAGAEKMGTGRPLEVINPKRSMELLARRKVARSDR